MSTLDAKAVEKVDAAWIDLGAARQELIAASLRYTQAQRGTSLANAAIAGKRLRTAEAEHQAAFLAYGKATGAA